LRNPALGGPSAAFGAKILSLTADNARVFLVNAGVVLWGSRLSTYLFHRVLKLGEDKRLHKFYRDKDEPYLDSKRSNFPLNLASFWVIQAAWGYVCMLPVTLLNSIPANTGTAVASKLSLKWKGPISLRECSKCLQNTEA
jgi:steroid 5-alpha reductase family enzyme